MILKIGDRLKTQKGAPCDIKQFIASGGQGEIYRVNVNNQDLALKWYFSKNATPEQFSVLQNLLKLGPPSKRFLWPKEIIKKDSNSFGYIMELRESRFKSLFDLMIRKIDPSFRTLCKIGFLLSDSYYQLHAMGLCYRDISFGNAFIDPKTGSVRICDNDNVSSEDISTVCGTPKFMAPEIVRGEARPSIDTDLHSLAVLLFLLFCIHHPFEGEKEAKIRIMNIDAMNQIYGFEPTFIFDPQNDTNRPVPGVHDNAIDFWPVYPQFLKDLFIRTFTDGIRDPKNGRVREGEWRNAFCKLQDSIMYCGECGNENFYDNKNLLNNREHLCWFDKSSIQIPPRIRINQRIIMLNHDTKLYQHHLDGQYNYTKIISEVVKNPHNPDIWGLKNITSDNWIVNNPDGSSLDVIPGKSVIISSGIKINFGKVEGEIKT